MYEMIDENQQIKAQECSDQILQFVKNSNLHFALQETPFSVYITLRKKFVREVAAANLQKANFQSENMRETEKLKDSLIQIQRKEAAILYENDQLRMKIEHQESLYVEAQNTIEEISEKLFKAKVELSDYMSNNSSLEKLNKDKFEEVEGLKRLIID